MADGEKNKKTKIAPAFLSERKLEKLHKKGMPDESQLEAELGHIQYRLRYRSVFRSTVYTLIVVAALAALTATLFLPVLRIYGNSMTPTLSEGNVVVSVKWSELSQGDLVSFYYQDSILVKRVIASSGDWVDIDEDGNVYVNNELLEENYLEEDAKAYGTVNIDLPYQVPEGKYFVMGDHRSTSVDSRTVEVGCIAEEDIVGRIVFRLWPIGDSGFVE